MALKMHRLKLLMIEQMLAYVEFVSVVYFVVVPFLALIWMQMVLCPL